MAAIEIYPDVAALTRAAAEQVVVLSASMDPDRARCGEARTPTVR
jgi:hypothetical protein